MAVCTVCGKTTKFGNQVSFAGNRNNRTFKPNLQTVRAVINGRIKKVTVCTRCLKAGKIQKAI
ncbi:MAG: 50S ribosomal protein L28 [Candidatus Bipolaricaulota bacterium]|nr:50S ribosomal protein L28 [Candidatus Bipolaricaulota bacterium]MDW8031766.1 50S ribosomal protein L28 [Candidatus Bipolaricaulota bacterium]